MPLGQGQDGKPFLNFGKKGVGEKREDEEGRGWEGMYTHT